MDENFECYYCRMATEDLQKCVDHVIAEHGDKVLKLRTMMLNDVKKNFGFIPHDEMLPGQKAIVNI